MQLYLKILSGMTNSADSDQTAPRSSLIWVCTICICHFVRQFGIQNSRTFNVQIICFVFNYIYSRLTYLVYIFRQAYYEQIGFNFFHRHLLFSSFLCLSLSSIYSPIPFLTFSRKQHTMSHYGKGCHIIIRNTLWW